MEFYLYVLMNITLFWLIPGFIFGMLFWRVEEGDWNPQRGLITLFTLGGGISILLLIGFSIEVISRRGFWKKKLINREPYEYHEY